MATSSIPLPPTEPTGDRFSADCGRLASLARSADQEPDVLDLFTSLLTVHLKAAGITIWSGSQPVELALLRGGSGIHGLVDAPAPLEGVEAKRADQDSSLAGAAGFLKSVKPGELCHANDDASITEFCEAALTSRRQLCRRAAQADPASSPSTLPLTSELQIVTPIQNGDRSLGLVLASVQTPVTEMAEVAACQRMQKLVDAVLPWFERQYVRRLQAERELDHRFREFCRELAVDPSRARTPAIVAQEYRRLFAADRVWVLLPHGRTFRVQAVSGVPGFQRQAEVVRRLEGFANRVRQSRQAFSWTAGRSMPIPPRLELPLQSYLDESHVTQLRADPILEPVGLTGNADPPAAHGKVSGIVLCEWFVPGDRPINHDLWTAASQQVGQALRMAEDWSNAPLASWMRRWKRHLSVPRAVAWTLLVTVLSVVAGSLALMPIDYTIDAVGELQPVEQRHVFATSAGIVRELNVASGQDVASGESLLTLEDPQLELEFRRVEGELRTTERRISALEASRLDQGHATSDTVVQVNSLAGDLSEQRQKRENLQQEMALLQHRRERLVVASPIAGQVVTWELERQLTRRPVARGQRLMTVADTRGPWQVELRIADEDSFEVCEALGKHQQVPVDFIVVTMPGVTRSTHIHEVSTTVEIRAPGEGPTLQCRGAVPEELAHVAVTGLGIRGRVHCGQRAAIVVGFRQFWRAIQQHVLFRWGF